MVRSAVVFALASFCVVLAHEQDRAWGQPQELCTLDNQEVDESSGVAASHLTAGVFFTHNDSGDTARFFRFQKSGKVDGVYSLKGAGATDWEDMASAVVGGKPYLYFGDVGDNSEQRVNVVVYRVAEPTTSGEQTIADFDTYTVKYPDGPHNCEALFVTKLGDVWVVTKEPGGNSKVYLLPAPKGSGSYTLQHVADLEVDTGGTGGKQVTGADLSPDQKFVVVRTYSAAFEYAVPAKFEEWTKSGPRFVRLAIETQGEAVAYSKDGTALVTTTEFAPCIVSVVPKAGK